MGAAGQVFQLGHLYLFMLESITHAGYSLDLYFLPDIFRISAFNCLCAGCWVMDIGRSSLDDRWLASTATLSDGFDRLGVVDSYRLGESIFKTLKLVF